MAASRDTLIRLVRALPDPPIDEIEVLGVDDFATTRGSRLTLAGTISPVLAEPAAAAPEARPDPAVQSRLEARFRERYVEIHDLRAEGKGMRTIGTELGLDRKTVGRFLHADSVEQLLTKTTSRATLLDEHKAHLHQRWNDGCTNVPRLVDELRSQGYRGSARTVYRYLQPIRTRPTAPEPTPAPPKIRDIVGWIMRDPANLGTDQEQQLTAVLARCPNSTPPAATAGLRAHDPRPAR